MSPLTPSHFRNHGAYDDVEIVRAYDRVAIEPIRLLPGVAPDMFELLEELFPALPEPPRALRLTPNRRAPRMPTAVASWIPASATRGEGDHVVVCFDLPGVSAEALRVSLVGETLEVHFELPRRAG